MSTQTVNIDLTKPEECLKLVNTMLNKSCKAGVYTIDEAYLIKLSMITLEKTINKNTESTD